MKKDWTAIMNARTVDVRAIAAEIGRTPESERAFFDIAQDRSMLFDRDYGNPIESVTMPAPSVSGPSHGQDFGM